MTAALDRLSAALGDRYRIERELGAGGMATVYLAEDLKHDRKVAIKVLKPELAAVLGAERFVQEIKTTAALSHPHILPLFDSGEAGGFLYYVMPYIQGETIREKLNRETQFGIDEAVRITTAIADALDYAHRQGVIHRDIKPENLLLHDGRPMVMDFGIALAVSAAAGGRMTETGLSLGTPHYMSPEQATAVKDITGRSDIYSLGSVLYEMLAGEPPHTGASAQAIVMKIIADTPRPVTELRRSVPPHVAGAVAKALEKLPADRFESARTFAEALIRPVPGILLEAGMGTVIPAASEPPVRRRSTVRRWGVPTALLIGGAAIGWVVRPAPDRPAPAVTRFTAPLPPGERMVGSLDPMLAISPDGQTLAFIAGEVLFKRDLAVERPERLAEVPGACCPTFSRDGRWILFKATTNRLDGAVSVDGGPVVDVNTRVRDEDLVFAGSGSATVLRRLAGQTDWTVVTETDSTGLEGAHASPQLLPGGRLLLFTVLGPGMMWTGAKLVVQDLESGSRTTIADQATFGRYLQDGYIVYATAEGNLEAVPFDARSRRATGSPMVVAEGVRVAYWGGAADFAVADNGTLAYVRGSTWALHQLTEVDRTGRVVRRIGDPATLEVLSLAPDGRSVASYVASANADISTTDLATGERRRLTFDETTEDNPVFSPDGRRITYRKLVTGREHRIVSQDLEGGGETTIFVGNREMVPRAWAPDGKTIALSSGPVLMLVDPEQGTVDTVSTQASWDGGKFSPDGRWLAYASTQTGVSEIYAVSFPGLGGRRQVSQRGGRFPQWAARSGELFFLQGDTVMVSTVATGAGFTHSAPRPLFTAPGIGGQGFVVTADGQRFIYPAPNPDAAVGEIQVVLNWAKEVSARLTGR
jgi:Tol biopolymer transport system component